MANEIGDFVKDVMPDISLKGAGDITLIFVGGIIIAGLLGWLFYYYLQQKRFNLKLVLFKNVGGTSLPVDKDKGMFQRIGMGGDYWLIAKKFKKILPRPRIQMAKNEYWFFERSDGEWINFSLKDLDKQMKKAEAYYVDEDMRLQRLGIQKNLQDRFQKVSWWQQYGGLVMNLAFLAVITVLLVFLFREMKDNWAVGRDMAEAVRDMAEQVKNMRQSGTVPIEESGIFIPFILNGFRKWKHKH